MEENLAAHGSFDGDLQELVTGNYGKLNNDSGDLGKIGFCRYYNGTDSYDTFYSLENFDVYLSGGFAHTFGVKGLSGDNLGSTITDINGYDGFRIENDNNGKLKVVVNNNEMKSTSTIFNDSGNLVGVSVNGEDSRIFLNTEDITDYCNISSGPTYSTSDMYIGRSLSGSDYSTMYLDEYSVGSRNVLSGDMVDLYNEGNAVSVELSASNYVLNENILNNRIINGNNGTTEIQKTVNKFTDRYITFNGSSDYIPLPFSYNSSSLSYFTFEAWVNTSDSSNQNILFSSDGNEYVRVAIGNDEGGTQGTIYFAIYTDAGQVDIVTDTVMADGTGRHIACVFDAGDIYIYLDGELEHSSSSGTTYGTGNTRYSFIGVGSEASSFDGTTGPDDYYNGSVTDIRIWEIARSQTEIQNNMNTNLEGTESGLVAYYRFDEGTGTTINDSSTNNYDATYQGTPTWGNLLESTTSSTTISTSGFYNFSPTQDIPLIFNPDSGYVLDEVIIDGSSVDHGTDPTTSYTISNVSQNTDIEITFRELLTLIIEANSHGGSEAGYISPEGNVAVTEFEDQTFNFYPYDDYRVFDYEVDGVSEGTNEYSYTFEYVTENHTLDVYFDNDYSNLDRMVVTTEDVEIDLSSSTSEVYSLTKYQLSGNCVPFVGSKGSGASLDERFLDVYFESGDLYITRDQPDSNTTALIHVVEFNPDRIKVTQGEFNMSGSETEDTISSVIDDPEKTFVIISWKVGNSSYWDISNVRAYFNGTDLVLDRDRDGYSIEGHYYIVESLSGDFTVQHLESIGQSEGDNIPEPVDIHKTAIFSSYITYGDAAREGTTRCLFLNNKQIGRDCYYYSMIINYQFVSFTEPGKIFVRHGHDIYSISESSETKNLPISLPGKKVISASNTNNQGIFYYNDNYTSMGDRAFCIVKIENDEEFSISRHDGSGTAESGIQFIDGDGGSLGTGTSPLSATSDLVKSVENFSGSLSTNKEKNFTYIPYGKNQNHKYCVPFITYISQTVDHDDYRLYVDITEEAILLGRGEGGDSDAEFELSVVEFNPEYVYVEKGFFSLISETSITEPISGHDLSGNVDLSRSIVHITSMVKNCGHRHDQANVRCTFQDSGTLKFQRDNGGSRVFGSYYLVEFLSGSNVYTNQYTSDTDSYTSTSYVVSASGDVRDNGVFPIHNSLSLVTNYNTSSADDQNENTIYYNHQFPQRWYANRRGTDYSIYCGFMMMRFEDIRNIAVQKLYYNMSTELSGSISLPVNVDYENSSVINPVYSSLGRTDGSSEYSIPESYVKLGLDQSGEEVYYQRTEGSTSNDGFIYVVDWSKTNKYSSSSDSSNNLIKSVENVSVSSNFQYEDILLTKIENSSNCVPFLTHKTDEIDGNSMDIMLDIENGKLSIYRNWGDSSYPVEYICGIVEFNPDRIKVKKYYFTLYGTDTLDIDIYPVSDINRAFIIGYGAGDAGNNNNRHAVRYKFNDNSSINIYKQNSGNSIFGVVYVVESLDESFYVGHESITQGGYNAYSTIGPEADLSKSIVLVSYATSSGADDPNEGQVSARKHFNNTINTYRFDDSYTIYNHIQIIQFDSGIKNSVQIADFYDSTTVSKSLKLPFSFNTENSVAFPMVTCNYHAGQGTDHAHKRYSCYTAELSGNEITIERQLSGQDGYPCFNAVEFNIADYYFEGTVKEGEEYVNRKVACYRRSTNELVDTDISEGENGFRLETPYNEEHYIVCLDDNNEPDFNALIYDRITPMAKE